MLLAAACAPPNPGPLLLGATGGQRTCLNSGLHGHVLEAIVIGDQRALQAKGQGQDLEVNR